MITKQLDVLLQKINRDLAILSQANHISKHQGEKNGPLGIASDANRSASKLIEQNILAE